MLRRSQGILYRVCLAFTDRQPGSIDDLRQEIVCNLWQGWPKFRAESDTTTWVYRVALNTARSELRKQRRHGRHSTLPIDARLCDTLADEKELVFLYLDGLTNAQIAAVTGASEAAAKQRIYRIRQKLIILHQQDHE